jgi:hypothetical protein
VALPIHIPCHHAKIDEITHHEKGLFMGVYLLKKFQNLGCFTQLFHLIIFL